MISRPTDHRDNRSQRATPADPVPILTCAYSHVYLIMKCQFVDKRPAATEQEYKTKVCSRHGIPIDTDVV